MSEHLKTAGRYLAYGGLLGLSLLPSTDTHATQTPATPLSDRPISTFSLPRQIPPGPAPLNPENNFGVADTTGITSQDAQKIGAGWIRTWDTDITLERSLEVRAGKTPFIPTFRTGSHWERQGFSNDPRYCNLDYCLAVETKVRSLQEKLGPGNTHYYIVGNEPEGYGPDTDQTDPATYATHFEILNRQIRKKDPAAKIVAPGIAFWEQGNGQAWYQAFYDHYRSRFGQNPPIDVLDIHLYNKDRYLTRDGKEYFSTDPMTLFQDLESARMWLDSNGQSEKPIIIGEFGMPNCMTRYYNCAPYDHPELIRSRRDFVDNTIPYFHNNRDRLNLMGWTIFATYSNWRGPNDTEIVFPINTFSSNQRGVDKTLPISDEGWIYRELAARAAQFPNTTIAPLDMRRFMR
jgi:hypothetical protein